MIAQGLFVLLSVSCASDLWANDPTAAESLAVGRQQTVSYPASFDVRIPVREKKTGQYSVIWGSASGIVEIPLGYNQGLDRLSVQRRAPDQVPVSLNYKIQSPTEPPAGFEFVNPPLEGAWRTTRLVTSVRKEDLTPVVRVAEQSEALWSYRAPGTEDQISVGRFAGFRLTLDSDGKVPSLVTPQVVFESRVLQPKYSRQNAAELVSEGPVLSVLGKRELTEAKPSGLEQHQAGREFILEIRDSDEASRRRRARGLGTDQLSLLRAREELAVRKLARLSDGSFLVAPEYQVVLAEKDPLQEISIFKVPPEVLKVADHERIDGDSYFRPQSTRPGAFARVAQANLRAYASGQSAITVGVQKADGTDFRPSKQRVSLAASDLDTSYFDVKSQLRVGRVSADKLASGEGDFRSRLQEQAVFLARAIDPSRTCPFEKLR